MKKTFVCDESMIITIPIGNLRDREVSHVMPENFRCVFKDSFKVFVVKGKPKPLGAAQAITGVFLCALGLILRDSFTMIFTLPSVLFVVTGVLTYAAGQAPHMPVAKLSFSLDIISFFWSIGALSISVIHLYAPYYNTSNVTVMQGISGLVMSLLVVENLVSLFLIYWLSKAVCRQHFNTLPTILLKRGD
ncbi:uncharacterized protein LOC121186121 [Toxotes jaculatrix]|uniref:uncharacterized protein LOC121186121 n=1 Tax=Toxotes jaculatrix TaxID=941984 RepID=UPI001B3AEAFA|nr:uncharacterized protein LOC121186121 [Toxotes jaculatrix]